MNFKKFISGVSALAIAASAFTAMTITASAAAVDYGTYSDYAGTAGLFQIASGDACTNDTNRVVLNDGAYIELDTTKDYIITFTAKGAANNRNAIISLCDASGNILVSGGGLNWGDNAVVTINVNNTDATAASTITQSANNAGTWSTAADAVVGRISFTGGSFRYNYGTNITDPNQTYAVTFTETNNVEATVKINGNDVTSGTSLPNGTYSYTATADGYQDYTGSITVNDAAVAETFTMTAKTPITSLTINYMNGNDPVPVATTSVDTTGLYVGESYTYYSVNYVQDNSGNYYYVAGDYTAAVSWSSNNAYVNSDLTKTIASLEAVNTITYSVTPVSTGKIVFYGEGETLNNSSWGNSWDNNQTGNRWVASGGKTGGGYTNGYTLYTTTEAGIYQATVVLNSANRGTEIVSGETSILKNSNSNNSANGHAVVGSAELASGAVIQVKGNGGSASTKSTDNIDYIVIRKLSNTVTVANTTNGTVTSDVAYAKSGDTVTLTVTPDSGYEVDTITVTGASGDVEVTNNTFEMPAEAVTVTVTFKATAPAVTASVTNVTDVSVFKNGTDGTENAVTAAVLNVTVANGSAAVTINCTRNSTSATTATITGNVLLGAVFNGDYADLSAADFTTAIVE